MSTQKRAGDLKPGDRLVMHPERSDRWVGTVLSIKPCTRWNDGKARVEVDLGSKVMGMPAPHIMGADRIVLIEN